MTSATFHRWRRSIRKVFKRLRFTTKSAPLGIFGAPNAGKSSLANVFVEDFSGDVLSAVSAVPHETRKVERKQRLVLTDGDEELLVDVLDTPGLSSSVTTDDLQKFHGMSRAEAERRAKDAIRGMLDAIKALERVEGVLLVIDSTQDPAQQVNEVILANARARGTPVVVVANKIDLPNARPELVEKAFAPSFPVVRVSVRTRENVAELYRTMCRTFD